METLSKLNTFINQKSSFLQSASPSPSYVIQALESQNILSRRIADDGHFIAEVILNDLPINLKCTLLQNATHEQIIQTTGVHITIDGRQMNSAERQAALNDPGFGRPLHLLLESDQPASIDAALVRIYQLMQPTPPPSAPPPAPSICPRPGPNYFQERLFIGALEQCEPEFGLRARIFGPNGLFLQHIARETQGNVCLRGRGSGTLEPESNREAFEPLQIFIVNPNFVNMQRARLLCQNLLDTIGRDYQQFLEAHRSVRPLALHPTTAQWIHGLARVPPPPPLLPQAAFPAQGPPPALLGAPGPGPFPSFAPPSSLTSFPPPPSAFPPPELLVPSSVAEASERPSDQSTNKPDSDSPAVEASSKARSKKPEKRRRRFVEAPESSAEKPKASVADATPPAPAAKGEATASEPVKRARTFREKPDRREPVDEPRPPEPSPPATALPSAAAASEPPKPPVPEFAMPAAPVSSLVLKSFAAPIAPAPRTRKEATASKSKAASKQKETKAISSALLSVFAYGDSDEDEDQ